MAGLFCKAADFFTRLMRLTDTFLASVGSCEILTTVCTGPKNVGSDISGWAEPLIMRGDRINTTRIVFIIQPHTQTKAGHVRPRSLLALHLFIEQALFQSTEVPDLICKSTTSIRADIESHDVSTILQARKLVGREI